MKMRRLYIVTLFLIAAFGSRAQIYQQENLFGKETFRYLFKSAVGIPNDTIAPPLAYQSYPHLAAKDSILYVWSPSGARWRAISAAAAGGGGGSYTFMAPLSNNSGVVSLTSVPWSLLTGKPTTLSGYGITDAVGVSDTAAMLINYVRKGIAGSSGHTHIAADVTDLTTAVRNMFFGGTGVVYNNATGVIAIDSVKVRSWLGEGSTYAFTGPLSESGGTVSITQANGSTNGYLSAVDWTLFNSKVGQSALDDTAATLRDLIAYTGTRMYDSYNTHDTLTQSRGIWMQTYGLTFYSSDGTTQNATGINNDGFTTKRGNGSLTQNSTWVYGQIQDPTSTYISRFQAIGLTNDSTHSTSLISTNGTTYNRKAAVVSAAWHEGVKLQANVNWKTSGDAAGYKGLTLTGGDGLGAGALSIDKEVLPEGAGQALLYDSTNNRVYRGTASGGGSSYKAFQTAVDGATVTFDMSLTDNWQVTIAGNRNFSFTNASNGQFLTLKLTQDATGSREPVWPASFKWIGATAPDFSDTGGTTDIITAVYDGTTWWANYGKNYN